MSIPSDAAESFWSAQDFALRVMNELWNGARTAEQIEDYKKRRAELLAAVAALDPKDEDWKHNDALYRPGKNPYKATPRDFDVVTDDPSPPFTFTTDISNGAGQDDE